MKIAVAFLRLVRWPNLVFIVLTQALFYSCIYQPLYHQSHPRRLFFLVAASVFIAAAGYIINDYFDLNIDRVNKPERNVLDRTIHRRWAILLHLALSAAGLVCTAFAVGFAHWYVILANAGCVLLLWFYSTSFKRRLLIGNFVISLLTAWTILVLFFSFSSPGNAFYTNDPASPRFFRLAFLYAGFAFILSLIREAVKDMEDIRGDARYGCRTLPIAAGIRTTKIYTGVWWMVLLAALAVLQVYVLQFGWWPSVLYALALVIAPLVWGLKGLIGASSTKDFAALSSLTKWVMLTGILSMLFFKFYF